MWIKKSKYNYYMWIRLLILLIIFLQIIYLKLIIKKYLKNVLTNIYYGGKVLLVREIRTKNKSKKSLD